MGRGEIVFFSDYKPHGKGIPLQEQEAFCNFRKAIALYDCDPGPQTLGAVQYARARWIQFHNALLRGGEVHHA